jgi:hypothetical protein
MTRCGSCASLGRRFARISRVVRIRENGLDLFEEVLCPCLLTGEVLRPSREACGFFRERPGRHAQ